MKLLFIINRQAGKNESYKLVEDQLSKHYDAEVRYTEYSGHAAVLAKEFSEKYGKNSLIFACGGDGTLNEVICGSHGLGSVVAPVPTGSGNDFIRDFEIPRESYLDIDSLINGRDVEIDLICCNDKISGNSVTVGFDCAVAKNVERFKKKRFISPGLAYKLSIFYCLFKEWRHKLSVVADGRSLAADDCLLSLCAKGKYYGGGIKCAPKASRDDGKLDFMYIPTIGVLKFISLLPTFSKGGHIDNPKTAFIRHFKSDRVIYEADEPFEIGIDGEILTVDKAEIGVLKGAQTIRIPLG